LAFGDAERSAQCRIPLGIQAGIGLVQHQEARIAVEGAGQCDPVPLAAGKEKAALVDLGLIALRQLENQLMATGEARCFGNGRGVGVGPRLLAGSDPKRLR
jgi:hypothetical protein